MSSFFKNNRRIISALTFLVMLGGLIVFSSVPPSFAQGPGTDVEPAPASIGADIPLTYFGPTPSQVQRELIGPYQLLKSGPIDLDAGTITLPLYEGQMSSGEKVWYILTDTTDKGNADALGLNWSPKLSYAAVGRGARQATL
jgi:hypothetical protein